LLREWLDSPLLSSEMVNLRLDGVDELVSSPMLLDELRDTLKELQDMQRLITQVSYGSAGPRVLLNLKNSLAVQPRILAFLGKVKAPLFGAMLDNFDLLEDICSLLEHSIDKEAPVSPKDSGVIKKGFDAKVDELRHISASAHQMVLDMEAAERERTGIKTLKIGYNKVFGYYIEISKSRVAEAPDNYIRKQTLVNGERFITQELKDLEDKVLNAAQQLADLEYRLFCDIRDQVAASARRIIRVGEVCAHLDALQSLAFVALRNNYCRPQVDDDNKIIIREGRHPVVEKIIGAENYIPNDTYLDKNQQRMMLITGPNMTGKSTYMRQVALIVLMAHMGSFVPAEAARIGYVDRIFTRVGASDDLAGGQSTFMVEMTETSNILRNATENSLIILDEIGRGTSTYDGLSIAWAVAEYIINDACAAKTLFATHYHELTALADRHELLKNYSIAVKEKGSSILFLHKIVEGAADRSYGIQVAQLAGLPKEVILRAKNILLQLEADSRISGGAAGMRQLSILDMMPAAEDTAEHPIISAIRELDLDSVSPLDALLKLDEWKKELKNEG